MNFTIYKNIETKNYNETDFIFAQQHLRIISGLYGLLRPLDLIQPYRLEMGTKLINSHGKNLYEFWGDKITQAINSELNKKKSKLLINLASQEYFKSIRESNLDGELINIIFKEQQGDNLKIIGLFAKQARGKMANFIIKNRITEKYDLTNFKESDYQFNKESSDNKNYIFTRTRN